MHAQHGDACVDGIDVAVGHILGHGAAAAGVDLAHLADLPHHAGLVQHAADIGHGLGPGIGGAALTPGAGVLADAQAVVHPGFVALFIHLGKIGVEGGGNVGGQAEGALVAHPQADALPVAQVLHEGVEEGGLHTGDAHGADLLLVGQHAHGGLFGNVDVKQALQCGIAAHPVVVSVGADEAAVQAQIRGVEGGDHLQLGGGEVILADAVFLVEQVQHPQLHAVGVAVLTQGAAAHENVQILTGNGLAEGLFALLRTQVGQQVGNHELGLVALAQNHLHHGAVPQDHHAPQLQGDGHPLVLADAAVIVGLAVGQLAVLIQGMGLEVQTGRVDVRGHDLRAVGQVLAADFHQHHALAAIAAIYLVAGLELHAPLIGDEALGLGQLDGVVGALPLGLAVVQILLVGLAIGLHGFQGSLVHQVIAVFGAGEQLFALGLHFVCHGFVSSL